MTLTLIQKHILHGTQVLELHDDVIKVSITSLVHGNKQREVELAMLNPEPVIDKSQLHFHSRVRCSALLSLYINKPNAQEFNAFVKAVQTKAQNEFNAFAGLQQHEPGDSF